MLSSNPQIVDLRERVYPLQRTVSFCKIFHPGAQDVKEGLGDTQVIQLILQHLYVKGFKRTRIILEEEARVKMPTQKLHSSRLLTYLRTSMRDVERLYDTFVGEKEKDSRPFEECVTSMDLHEEGKENNEDVNIWEEGEGNIELNTTDSVDPNVPHDQQIKQTVRAGSLNKLVEKLTDDTLMFDATYIPTFMMTYQSFATPEKLMQKLCERFDVPESVPENVRTNIQMRVCKVLKKWIETYPNDFDDRTRSRVRMLIEQGKRQGSTFVSLVENSFNKMLSDSRKQIVSTGEPPYPILPHDFFNKQWNYRTLLDLDDEEIARQLTVMDWKSYAQIKPSELLDCAWSKPKLRYRSPHVLDMIRMFNVVSGWVVFCIVKPKTVKERSRVMAKFIGIAERLLALNNYNSLMSILSGVNSSAVSRMKYTFEELSAAQQKSLRDLLAVMSSDNNFHYYRAHISSLDDKVPKIPYLGVSLTDLTFCQENADYINGLINFSKRTLLYQIISAVLKHQFTSYTLQPVQQILFVLRTLPVFEEQKYYRKSLKREPRGFPRSSIL